MTDADAALPPLREDLRLHEAVAEPDGSPSWTIQDPVTNRFFRIGWLEFEYLVRWPGSARQIANDIAANTPLATDAEQVLAFAGFLDRHRLLRPSAETVARLARDAAQPGWRHWRWWLHHYLFFRIPLVRPERWLAAALPLVRRLGSNIGLGLIGFASAMGVLLTLRQWDSFRQGLADLLTPAGIAGFVVALIVAKTGHELGHAFVSTRYGARVSHMGIAFVVLWPMLYTDTSESWKLRDARHRLAISSAGIAVELALAGLATLAWALLDEGAPRQAMLYLATTGWVLTLALNLSPFMRFDGYFILSDLIDFPNLHERASAVALTWLRRHLLGWNETDSEPLSRRVRLALVAFAFATWAYRLVIFLAIAVAVYLFFFKALGIFLFAVEIAWFIIRPVAMELSVWRRRGGEIRAPQRRRLIAVGALMMLVLLIPWAGTISAPSLAHSARQQAVFSPFAARLVALGPAGPARAGTPLAVFESPDLQVRAERTVASLDALGNRIRGLAADDAALDQRRSTSERLGEQIAEAQAQREEVARLRISAEFDGVWLDLDPNLRGGSWIGNRQPVGMLIDPGKWVVDAFVEQRDAERLRVGARARFYPEGRWRTIDARVIDIDPTRSARLPWVALDARHGGPIATRPGDQGGIPSEALYRVRLELAEPLAAARETRGRVAIDGSRRSPAWAALATAVAVIVRESGF